MKKLLLLATLVALSACTEADVVSHNLSRAADSFDIQRRIVFYNGITNTDMLVIEGLCSLGNFDAERELTVTCKTAPGQAKKHFLGLSDNVTYFAEQIDATTVSEYHYRFIVSPRTAIPQIQVR